MIAAGFSQYLHRNLELHENNSETGLIDPSAFRDGVRDMGSSSARQALMVHRVAPASLMATSERVAVPVLVVAGVITTAYVPPLNGSSPAIRPPMAFVHATAPEAVAMAVIVELTDPSLASVSLTDRRLLPDRTRRSRPSANVAVHRTLPAGEIAVIVVDDGFVELFVVVLVT
jgi:hypothetical protein